MPPPSLTRMNSAQNSGHYQQTDMNPQPGEPDGSREGTGPSPTGGVRIVAGGGAGLVPHLDVLERFGVFHLPGSGEVPEARKRGGIAGPADEQVPEIPVTELAVVCLEGFELLLDEVADVDEVVDLVTA